MKKQFIIFSLYGCLLTTGVANAQTCSNTAIPESTPTNDFIFNDNGTVIHKTTGLMWKRCMEGQNLFDSGTPSNYYDDKCAGSPLEISWQSGLEQAKKLNSTSGFAGYMDWRVPNYKELKSIVEYCGVIDAINYDVFPHIISSHYSEDLWSSTPMVNYPLFHEPDDEFMAWSVSFDSQGLGIFNSRSSLRSIRLVRSSQ